MGDFPPMITENAVGDMLARERALYVQRNPRSKALAEAAADRWLHGVPMQWMVEWPVPFPLSVSEARGITLKDVDGNTYRDFCLGDTGAMFGHSPPAIAEALSAQASRGLTTMLPSADAPVVGELLADRFGLPFWQVTATASDANRSILRWSRAVTGRRKILVFNGCYHGAVDGTFLTIRDGQSIADPGLIGEAGDLLSSTKVVEFNDLAALEEALARGDVACVLAEPVMTNCGMVLPDPGFHARLRDLTRATSTILVIDETHCMSSGPGGYCREYGLEPDAIVLGKPIAGGIPAAVYGVSAELAARIGEYLKTRTPGHSGIGTTLSGSAIQLAMMRRVLENYFTVEAFMPMIERAKRLETGIARCIARHAAPWHVVRVGARVEFMCTPNRPRNGGEAMRAIHRDIDRAVHLYLLNRGLLVTPFHNMLLIAPATTDADVDALVDGIDGCLRDLVGSN